MTHPAIPSMLCLLLLGCAGTYRTHPPVPPAFAELVPEPPQSDVSLIWQPGHFDWDGSNYATVPGRWVERAGHGTLWQDGYWKPTDGDSVWVPGHWL